MMRKLIAYVMVTMVLVIISSPGWTMDYGNMTNDELAALRGAIQNAPESEQKAFLHEWENRMEDMTEEEKKQYSEQAAPDPEKEEMLKQPYVQGRGYDNQGTGTVIYGGGGPLPQGARPAAGGR